MQKKAEEKEVVDLEKVEFSSKVRKEIDKSMKILEAFKKIRQLEMIAEIGAKGELIIQIKMDVKMGLVIRKINIPAGQWNHKEE
jgi:hypothetical protein